MKKMLFLLVLVIFPVTAFAGDTYSWHRNASNVTPWYRGAGSGDSIPIWIQGTPGSENTGAATSVTLVLWASNGGVTGNIRIKVYNSSGTYVTSSNNVDASTITSYSGYSWFPGSISSAGSPITFTFSSPIALTTAGFFIALDCSNVSNGYNNGYDVQFSTAYGSGWDSTRNKVCYQEMPNQLPTCSTDSESADVVVGFATLSLAYPLGESRAVTGYSFGDNWAYGECPSGTLKKHAGLDLSATHGDDVFAAEAGTVVHISVYSSQWAQSIVVQHTAPGGWTYTTVYWHVDPMVSENDQVTKGQHIADVADIANDHLHFGLRLGSYATTSNGKSISGAGALPVADCDYYPAFPNWFINAANSAYITFQ